MYERDLIKSWTTTGRARAVNAGEAIVDVARGNGVTHATISRLLARVAQ